MEQEDRAGRSEGRSIPIWVFLLCLLLGVVGMVSYGWLVRSTLLGTANTGIAGLFAVNVAEFPSVARTAFLQVISQVTGKYVDEAVIVPRPSRDYSGFSPLPGSERFGLDGLLAAQGPSSPQRGWRILVGAFNIEGKVEFAAIAISPDLEIERVWILDEPTNIGPLLSRSKYRKFVHGFEYLSDGSFVFAFDGGISLQRFDGCGNRLWAIPGSFSHSVSATSGEMTVWATSTDRVSEVAVGDGKIVRVVTMQDIIDANPDIDILETRQYDATDPGLNTRNSQGNWLPDPFHLNDVDPLPASRAAAFSRYGFNEGDLLISSRSASLVFVVDPDTRKVKWWRTGATRRQHDPDWEADGRISVFNNRMNRDYSEILTFDPATFEKSVLLDGAPLDFYTRIRGKHQTLPEGAIAVTSPQQGYAFEVGPDGETALEFVNFKTTDAASNYVISELFWLPEDAVNLTPCPE